MRTNMKTGIVKMISSWPVSRDREGVRRSRFPFSAESFQPGAISALSALLMFAPAASAMTTLFTGATVHTVSGEILTPGEVLVQDGRIIAVGTNIPRADAETVTLSGLHLYPGLIAAPTLLGLTEINAVRATRDTTEVGEYVPDVQSWIAVNPDSELLPVARANGITHALPTPMGGMVSGLSGLVALDGWTTEEMTIKKPAALHLFWPSLALDTTPREQSRDRSQWKSLEDQAKERQRKLKALEEFFEEARAYARTRSAAAPSASVAFDSNPSWEAMLPVVRGEVPVMVHADEVRQIKAAIHWAESNRFNIILAGARDAWMLADVLAAKKIPVIYDNVFELPARDSDPYDVHFRAPGVLHKAGVTVAFSVGLGNMSAANVRNLPYLAAQAVAFGLPRDEAIKGITLYPAQMLRVADRLGSISAGKEATIFAADGDILDIRSNVKRLWIAGQEVSLESRHTRLYEKYRQRPRPASASKPLRGTTELLR